MTFLVSTDLAARHLTSRPSNFLPPSFQDPPTFSTLRGGAVTTKHGPNPAVAAYNIYHKNIPHIAKFFIAGTNEVEELTDERSDVLRTRIISNSTTT